MEESKRENTEFTSEDLAEFAQQAASGGAVQEAFLQRVTEVILQRLTESVVEGRELSKKDLQVFLLTCILNRLGGIEKTLRERGE